MSTGDAWMPLWIGDYAADTMHLGCAEHGAYLMLLMHSWRRGAPPDDEVTLARIARATPEEWARLRPAIEPFFAVEGGLWRHKRLEAERQKVTQRAARAAAKARAAAEARWRKKRAEPAAPADAPSMLQALPDQCPSPSPLESDSSLRSESARPAGCAQAQGALILPLVGGGKPIPADEGLGERVRREQGGEARRILRSLAPALSPQRMGEMLGAWCKHLHGDRALLLHVLRDAERHAAAERIVGDPIRWLWGLVRQRASNSTPHSGAPHEQPGRAAERRTYGGGGSAASRLGVLDAFPELAAGMEGD